MTLRLRSLAFHDIDTLANWGQDRELCEAAEWSPDRTMNYLRHFWRTHLLDTSNDLIRLAVVTEDDRLIGYTDLFSRGPDRRELGFVIGERSLWGKGYGTEAAALMLEHGFQRLGLSVIEAQAWNANVRSIGVLQRLGMREKEPGESGVYRGESTYYRTFELTAREWEESSRRRSTEEQ